MQRFDILRQLRNEKKYDTTISKLKQNNNGESSPVMNASGCNVRDEPEAHVFTQEEVNDQIRSHIAPLTRKL